MKSKLVWQLSFLFTLVMAFCLISATPSALRAAEDGEVGITEEMTVAEIQTAIQTAIDEAETSGTVTVTGSKTDAIEKLDIDIPAVLFASDVVCEIVDTDSGSVIAQYTNLADALDNTINNQTIKLLTNITYNYGISIIGKTITFDTNGFTLDVVNHNWHGLEVGSGGIVILSDSGVGGTLNVASIDPYGYGLYVHDGGEATVTTAKGGTSGTGVSAYDSNVTVLGDVKGNNTGIFAYKSTISVTGDVTGGYYGLIASDDSIVAVNGNIKSSNDGVMASHHATVNIFGSVWSSNTHRRSVYASYGATVNVFGSIWSIGPNSFGVLAEYGATVTVDGAMTVSYSGTYIAVDNVNKEIDEGILSLTKPGYLEYIVDTSCVFVRSSPVHYTVTVINGWSDKSTYIAGESVSIVSEEVPTNKVFGQWITEDGVRFSNNNTAHTSFIMPPRDVTVESTFDDLPSGYYELSLLNDGNGICISTHTPIAREGDVVTLMAVAGGFNVFYKWVAEAGLVVFDDEFAQVTTFVMPAESVVIRATFAAQTTYTITFDANGGTGEMNSILVVQGDDYIVGQGSFAFHFYRFTGWNTAANGSGTSYTPGDKITDIQSDVTLYAQWQSNNVASGDVNSDGVVNMADILLIYQHFRGRVQLTGLELIEADINGNGKVDMADVLLVYHHFRGIS